MWNAWIAERFSSPANCRNHWPTLTNRFPMRNCVSAAQPEKASTQRAQRTQRNSRETEKGKSAQSTNHKSRFTNHDSCSPDSKQFNNAHNIRRGDVVQRPLVFLLELLSQILRGDVARFAVRNVAAGAGGKLNDSGVRQADNRSLAVHQELRVHC